MMMLEWIVSPFTYEFMQRGLMASAMVGVLCAVVGCYVVLRSMAFLGDAMAHAILPGVAAAYLLKLNLLAGALAAAILVALGIGFVSRHSTLKEDTAIGILFAGALSLGIAMISTAKTYASDLTHILFGNVLGVSTGDLWLTAVAGLLVLATIVLFYKEFLVISFDPVLATTLRLPKELLRTLMLVLIAVTIVISLQTVGVGLVTSMLVTPGATAYILTRRLPVMMVLSACMGAVSTVAGLYISFYVNIASGAAVVMVATALFLAVFTLAPKRGFLWRYVRKSSPSGNGAC
ncbi:MAG: metal ABC transporter permease [Syntrophobacteraceae bacterium]|nr:metal ABC transporter permease [Desulfobacteraceae bacterium]